ncbi:hypothetical protein RHO13_09980 [Orbus wheelerorum]|uniref:hypothetical protein n=1 Tax=Orbus wheelerorum TaxID=3074111 RepID=UPI00370D3672
MSEPRNFLQQLMSKVEFITSKASVIINLVKWLWGKVYIILGWYKKWWVKFTYNKYDEFVYKRGVAMLIVTLLIPIAIYFVLLTGYYFATYKKEVIYLNHSEELYPAENIWGVRGCYSDHCDSESSIYFRIKPSVFHHMWNMIHHGNIFLPDSIGASVPTGLTQCEVISYGMRMRMTMYFNIYPNILHISCQNNALTSPKLD